MATVVTLPPGDRGADRARCVEAVHRLLGHDEDAAALVDREGVADLLRLTRVGRRMLRGHQLDRHARPSRSGSRCRRCPAVVTNQRLPLPVGKRRLDGFACRSWAPGCRPCECDRRPRGVADREDGDPAVDRRHHCPVVAVEVEVPAATERRRCSRRRSATRRRPSPCSAAGTSRASAANAAGRRRGSLRRRRRTR